MRAKVIYKMCIVLLCLLLLPVGMTGCDSNKTDGYAKETENAGYIPTMENAAQGTIAEDVAKPTPDATTQPQQNQPASLTMLLAQNGTTYEDLAQRGCAQLVCVAAQGSSAVIRFFTCDAGVWREHNQLFCKGHVGRSGVATDKKEGDGSTPWGLYGIGSAFYIDDAPETALDVFQITNDTYWVDDPDSAYYNQRVEGLEHKDWDSAEHMIDYTAYRYGFVVEYNLTAEYNAGSAIFFHVGDNPTAGCIATQTEMVKAYLAELDATRNPCILIS